MTPHPAIFFACMHNSSSILVYELFRSRYFSSVDFGAPSLKQWLLPSRPSLLFSSAYRGGPTFSDPDTISYTPLLGHFPPTEPQLFETSSSAMFYLSSVFFAPPLMSDFRKVSFL